MENKLEYFLTLIHLDNIEEFKNTKLLRVIVNNKDSLITIFLETERMISVDNYLKLKDQMENYFNSKVEIRINNLGDKSLYLEEYFKNFLPEYGKYFQDRLKINGDNNNYIVAYNQGEEREINNYLKGINTNLVNLGYNPLTVFVDEENRANIRKMINENLTNIEVKKTSEPSNFETKTFEPRRKKVKTVEDERVYLGEVIEGDTINIKDIVSEDNDLIIECEIFGVDIFESTKSNYKIITLKLTDYTDSMYAKVFTTDSEELKRLVGILKPSKWFKFKGYTKRDKYTMDEIVFNISSINVSDKKNVEITDLAPIKRVELHTHTMMSAMDGVCAVSKHGVSTIEQAIKWGHKAIAITDHSGCQAFPNAYNMIVDYNKGKPKEEHFKVIYGTELTLVDDNVSIVKRSNNATLLAEEYVVFDLETTGFNAAGGDSIIEIGAVKLKDGEIIDKFDKLIKPPKPITERITSVTSITNEMVADCPNEEIAVKEFLKWAGDDVMVAHNAKFDTSFIEMCYKKYNLGEYKNTVIDTLALSRILDQEASRHGLSAITKRYGVEFDEESHHRGDYDALATALVFHKMMKKLEGINILKISDLETLISSEDIHKFGRTYHVNILVQNKVGLKNLFKIISIANTKHFYKTARILRSEIEALREGLLIGSGCYESEVFVEARNKTDSEIRDIIGFYDYVEVQPPECYGHLIQLGDFKDENELIANINKIIKLTKETGKIIVATGDVHHLTRSDKIYREIIVNQKLPGGGLHPLAKRDITEIPSQHFRTTDEMLEDFNFLDEKTRNEIVIENTNKIADMVEEVEVIIDTGGIPFSPRIENSKEDVYEMVFNKAHSMYGDPLPRHIEERIAEELYGDRIIKLVKNKVKNTNPDKTEEELDKLFQSELSETIKLGYDEVFKLNKEDFINNILEDKEKVNDEAYINKETKKLMGGIIGGGFDVIYLIAQKLVKHSNDEGYLVGSRGSVGSSFVATMMGITEVNPLPAHYLCKKCHLSLFNDEDGNPYSLNYSASGYDLPDKMCPNCNTKMSKEGQDMPFATFLGFNADKVPDIDLNFSGDNQASAHAYTKVIFGEDNVYRAGTIGTVAEKTAYGFVRGYFEKKGVQDVHMAEIERLAVGCTGVKRTTGQHPGGIVVIPSYMDVFDFTPFQYPADDVTSVWRTTHFDYHAIDQDVLKLDILGHDDPTILRMLQDLSGIDVTTLPMDDPKVLSLLTSPDALGVSSEEIRCEIGTLGLPEMGTNFVINMLVKAKPKTFGELVKISGLSHGTDVWNGNAEDLIDNHICEFKEVIGCRDDIMVYLKNHGLKPKDAFKIMEFVRKGKAKKEPEKWLEWKQVMIDNNIPDWYIESCHKIQYMFPKAHACAYVMSAIRIAWFKVYQPLNYYATFFSIRVVDFDIETMIKGYDAIKLKIEDLENKSHEITKKEGDILETLKIALEATARGIKFANINLQKSDAVKFIKSDTEENTLIPPFRAIDGLGDTVGKTIVQEREIKEFLSMEDLQKRGKVSTTLIDKMRSMKILDSLPESNQLSLF
ncbi:MAG: PolC-type DNA polymerase III [Erysipelotrichaceae bacterium]|nr:PolC-type DNA polymerase III [Erysipelotrichaceae bacterium]